MAGVIHACCMKKRAACALRISDIKLKDRQLFAKREKRYAVMSFIIMTARIMVNVRLQKMPVGTRSWECVHAGSDHWWGFAHLSYYSNPKFAEKFAEACRSYKTNKIAKKEMR